MKREREGGSKMWERGERESRREKMGTGRQRETEGENRREVERERESERKA